MRFAVNTKTLPWRIRLKLLLGARIISGAFVHDGLMTVTVGVKWRGEPIWWQEWQVPAGHALFDSGKGNPSKIPLHMEAHP